MNLLSEWKKLLRKYLLFPNCFIMTPASMTLNSDSVDNYCFKMFRIQIYYFSYSVHSIPTISYPFSVSERSNCQRKCVFRLVKATKRVGIAEIL